MITEEKEQCCDCKFYVMGDCHALPPVVIQNTTITLKDAEKIIKNENPWPQVEPDDWCGLFKVAKKVNSTAGA
jgi:hypothetical protein